MFYAEAILSKKGPLAKVWLAAHLERKLTKAQLLQASVPSSVGAIIGHDHGPPLALRLSGQLLLGVVRIYARKARYLLEDCHDALIRIKMAFRPGAADITTDSMVASVNSITLPEALTEFDILLPSSSGLGGHSSAEDVEDAAVGMNTSRIQDITLAEQSFDVSMVARGGADADLDGGFGMEGDLLGHDDNFKLDIEEDFVLSPPPQQLEEPGVGLDRSALEPEIGREAMAGLDESMIGGVQPEDISLLGKGVGGLNVDGSAMDIAREDDMDANLDTGDILRFGDDDAVMPGGQAGIADTSMATNTQEVALQEVEAEILAAATTAAASGADAGARPNKRRRLNVAELVASESTSFSPDEIRSHLSDPADIVRMPTYLSYRGLNRPEDTGAAVASKFLSSNSADPFAMLFAPSPLDREHEVPVEDGGDHSGLLDTSANLLSTSRFGGEQPESVVPEQMLQDDGDNFRIEEDYGDQLNFSAYDAELATTTTADPAAGIQTDQEVRLGDKSIEQLEKLEEESFRRQAAERPQVGTSLFTDALPVRDEDVAQFADAAEDHQGDPTNPNAAGYSKNTIRAVHILDTACKNANVPVADLPTSNEGEMLSYFNIAKGARRTDAVKLFFELLVLKSKDFVDVKQANPLEDVLIAPRIKLQQAADSISSNA